MSKLISYSTRLMIIISNLVLLGSACTAANQTLEATAPQPPLAPTPSVAVPTVTPTQRFQLGEVQRQAEGGYTYRTVPGYNTSAGMGIVSMLAEGANPEFGPSISLLGGPPDPGASPQSLLGQLKDAEDTKLSNPTRVKIGGYNGLAADIVIRRNDINIYGRIAVVVTPDVQFIALAASPWEHWAGDLQPLFADLLGSITFFPPEAVPEPTDLPAPTPSQIPKTTAEN